MNILHSRTDPDLLTRLQEMLESSARADTAEGVSTLPQTEGSEAAVKRLRDLVAAELIEVRAYL